MNSSINDLRYVFEKNLKWKLNQKAKSSKDEFKLLINNFRFYDNNLTGGINKDQWIKAILKIGLIGFSDTKLINLFEYYTSSQRTNNNTNSNDLNYKQFTYDLLYNSSNKPIIFKRENYFYRNKKEVKNINYSCDFQNKLKNNEENSKDKNIYNYKINVSINNEQHINKCNNNGEKKDNNIIYNNNYIKSNNTLTTSYNHHKSYQSKNIKLKCDQNNNISLKYFIKNIMDVFREKINKDNGVTFYNLLQNLKLNTAYEVNSDLLSISKLNLILKESNLNFTPKELQNLFCIIDFNDTGYISLNKFLKVIKGNLNEYRKAILINIFNTQIDIHKNGNISIYYFKKIYNPKNHPDVLSKKMNENEAMTQFTYTFDIFCKLYKILRDLNCSQFIKYYEGISPSISDDIYFKDIINKVWTRSTDFDDTYFPRINNQNINFNLEKKINRSISTPLMSFNNSKMNTLGNSLNNKNYNFNYNYKNNNNQLNILNSNYIKYQRNTLNNSMNSKICIQKVNLTPISNYPKNTPSLTLNDIQNNNMYNYKYKQKNNFNQFNNNYLNKSANINSLPHNNIISHNINNNNITNVGINKQEKDKYNYSKIILDSLRNILIRRGNKSIFYLQRMLTNCDSGHTGVVSLSQLNNIVRAYNFNIYFYDIKLLFELFDKNKVGIIQYDNLIKAIVGNMNEKRKSLIIKVYENLNKDLYGYINIKEIKKKYNCYKHPAVIMGNKTHEEVYGDFLECIEIYKEYIHNYNNKYNSDLISLNELLEFFDEISMYIIDDKDFEVLINGCWNLK